MTTKTHTHPFEANAVTAIRRVDSDANGIIDVNDFSYSQGSIQAYTSFFNGTELPDYRDRIRAHVEATTAASGRMWKRLGATPCTYTAEFIHASTVGQLERSVFTEATHGIVPGLGPARRSASSTLQDSVHARHVSDAMSRIDRIRGSLASAEDMGELKETLGMLVSPFKSFRKLTVDYIESLSKFKRAKLLPKQFLNVATDAYLEYNFGLKPIIGTISHVVTEVQRQGSRMSVVPFSVTTSQEHSESTEEVVIQLSNSYADITFTKHVLGRYVERWQGEVKAGGDENGEISGAKLLGATPDKWLPTLYNLIPYSFVLDYFINVGDIVTASTFRTSDIAWCCVTTRHETHTSYSAKNVSPRFSNVTGPTWFQTSSAGGNGGQQFFETVDFTRDHLRKADFVIPIQVKIPESWSKPWLNMVALLQSGFRARNQSYF